MLACKDGGGWVQKQTLQPHKTGLHAQHFHTTDTGVLFSLNGEEQSDIKPAQTFNHINWDKSVGFGCLERRKSVHVFTLLPAVAAGFC